MGNACALFSLLLLLLVLASSVVSPAPANSALPPNTPPFMVKLYNCVNKSSPLNCYGVDAKSVWSLLGSCECYYCKHACYIVIHEVLYLPAYSCMSSATTATRDVNTHLTFAQPYLSPLPRPPPPPSPPLSLSLSL